MFGLGLYKNSPGIFFDLIKKSITRRHAKTPSEKPAPRASRGRVVARACGPACGSPLSFAALNNMQQATPSTASAGENIENCICSAFLRVRYNKVPVLLFMVLCVFRPLECVSHNYIVNNYRTPVFNVKYNVCFSELFHYNIYIH